jgi:hypothetical protein
MTSIQELTALVPSNAHLCAWHPPEWFYYAFIAGLFVFPYLTTVAFARLILNILDRINYE